MHTKPVIFSFLLLLTTTFFGAGLAEASERWPSSELLLPCFEVRLDGSAELPPSLTTIFAVVNSADRQVPVRISVKSNWGLEILSTRLVLDPRQVQPINLATWILAGRDPADPPGSPAALDEAELEHVQAALCGERSPKTQELYSSAVDLVEPLRAVGSIVIRAQEARDADVLWGDFFIVEPAEDFAQGEVLANLDPFLAPGPDDDDDLCQIHAFRFMIGGGFNGGTEFMVWNTSRAGPSGNELFPGQKIRAKITAYAESGVLLASFEREFLPMEMVRVSDLALPGNFGWLKIDTFEIDTMIAVRYNALDRYSAAMETFCLEREELALEQPDIHIEKYSNGVDADQAPGPAVTPGASVEWRYDVTNTGDVPLSDIEVSDSVLGIINCPATALAPRATMRCTANGLAPNECEYEYENLGFVEGTAPDGQVVRDDDPSHYHVEACEPCDPDVDIDVQVAACTSPEDPVVWTYTVTNTGADMLTNIMVTSTLRGNLTLPSLAPLASYTWTFQDEGVCQAEDSATITADSECGDSVSASDADAYDCCVIDPEPGWMTGGGSVFTDGVRYTHGNGSLQCDTSRPSTLQINWHKGGKKGKFHLEALTSATCLDDPTISEGHPVAGFDTFIGSGTGLFDGVSGARIDFRFTDAGEPGKDNDWAEFTIVPPPSVGVDPIVVQGLLHSGNHQAHGR